MRRLVPLSLVALLLLSGCMSGLGGLGGTESTSTPEEADLPPGVNESGVQNASALIAGYNETVREEGIVLTVTENITYPMGYRVVRHRETTLAAGGRPFNLTTTTAEYELDGEPRGQPTFAYVWGNESATFARGYLTPPQEVDPQYLSDLNNQLTQAKQHLVVLQVANYTVDTVVERDGHTFTTLVTNESAEGSATWEARLVVDERGLIHERTLDQEEGDYEAHREYRIVETDPEPPEKPDWVANVTELRTENTTQNSSA
jgi:hypothetical protein